MPTSIELVRLLLIPQETSSLEDQILTLRHTLSKLSMLPQSTRIDVSIDMLKYMQSLDSQGKLSHLQSILGVLTETELEDLLSLVESATEQLKQQEYKKSAIPPSLKTHAGYYGVALGGLGSPNPPKIITGGLTTGVTGGLSYKDYEKLNWLIQEGNKNKLEDTK